jgi:hypothetical protein
MLGGTDSESAPRAHAREERTATAKPVDDDRDAAGRFRRGNRAWVRRASSGPAPKFADGESLWNACTEYFCWVEDNPLVEMQLVTFQGRATMVPLRKMRAMSKSGLCAFLGIERCTWNNWKQGRRDLLETIERVELVIWCWQFTGAAAGLLDAGLVIRQLHLGGRNI